MDRDFLGRGTRHRRIAAVGIRKQHGAEAVVFGRATPAGSAASDFEPRVLRLANAFGSPNVPTTTHICTWNAIWGSKHTFGTPTPPPDFENTRCILLWGANPRATFTTFAQRISAARQRGAKLIVVDPRQHRLAQQADCWLRVRPGSESALALAMIHVHVEEKLYDENFVREWTNGPFLVREDTGRLLTEQDLASSAAPDGFVAWDTIRGGPAVYRHDAGYTESGVSPALVGKFTCRLGNGAVVSCRPAFALLAERAAQYAPERSAAITWVPAEAVRRAARLFVTERPSCHFTWAGLEMQTNAMQTNRAVCSFYALTGQFDGRGSNVLTPMLPSAASLGNLQGLGPLRSIGNPMVRLLGLAANSRRHWTVRHCVNLPVEKYAAYFVGRDVTVYVLLQRNPIL